MLLLYLHGIYPLLLYILSPKRAVYIPIALFFSGIGDMTGAMGIYYAQFFFFVLAHITYIIGFIPKIKLSRSSAFRCIVLAIITLNLAYIIIPRVPQGLETIFVTIYILIIYSMGISTLLLSGQGKIGYVIAAMFFIFSDTIIAWNNYISLVPCRYFIVISTYFFAQYLFAITTIKCMQDK